ncbi:MAG: amidohydrolase family protein [Kordiimonadaceae bacterium]|nr:amidohydrolase family protein [Kordiimonadaceae bacterium]MBO6568215.1 amidohydrolase family protein [Kordiimonadaceae bacterium]MBO6964055.1 amidohydrolase family protein [Kordiimonadaceae bacterium]
MTRMLISFMILTLGISANAQENPEGFAIVGGMLIDGYEAPPVHNAVVLVRGNRIVASGPAHEVQVPEGTPIIDARGKSVLPGLIDLHIHLDLIGHGDYDEYYNFIGGTERLDEMMPIAAKHMMRAGVTTAVDLGSPFDILAVRERIRTGEIPGPRLIVSGPWITRIKLDGVPDSYQVVINSPEEAAAKTHELIDTGSDVIKTWLGLTRDDLKAVVAAAHSRGVKVHSHLYKVPAMEDAIAAGVDVLQHVGSAKMPPYPQPLLRKIAEDRIPVVQTIAHRIWVYPATEANPGRLNTPELEADMGADVFAELQRSFKNFRALSYFSDTPDEIRLSKINARQFIDANAYMGVGTDAASPLNFHTEAIWREMSALVDSGMTPARAITAATKTGAEIIDMGKELGTIQAGKLADIIIVDGNPLRDINLLDYVAVTIKNGEVWYDPKYETNALKAIGRAF